jgi:hypothetical protein
MLLEKMIIYLSFIEECKNKTYTSNKVIHKHHIFPKCIYGDNDEIVNLSVEDHIRAHLLMAECFEDQSIEQSNNLKSVRVLNKKSIKNKAELDKIAEAYKGVNNPFYGKKHSKEVLYKIASKTGQRTKGKTYKELYGDEAIIEKDKRSIGVKKMHESRSPQEKARIAKKISEKCKPKIGALNPMSKKVEVDGVKYDTVTGAMKLLNISKYKLIRLDTFKYLK